jgi:hypothetical protein
MTAVDNLAATGALEVSVFRHGISLLGGWFPLTREILAVVVLVIAIGCRTRRWRVGCLPRTSPPQPGHARPPQSRASDPVAERALVLEKLRMSRNCGDFAHKLTFEPLI